MPTIRIQRHIRDREIGILLNCSVRTVRRDIKALAKRGVIVPTRGQQKDIGPGVSHKVETVRLFIERKTNTKETRRIKAA